MKAIILLLLLLGFNWNSYSQDESDQLISKKEQRQFAREKRKAEQAAQEVLNQKITNQIIADQQFVLLAEFISDSRGKRFSVNSDLNFIIIDSTEATIQIGNNQGVGYNGVGGITVDGRVTRYEIKEQETKKGKNYSGTVYIMSSLGQYDIQFWITQSGNTDAHIRGNFSGSVNYSGKIVPLKSARIYKAKSIP